MREPKIHFLVVLGMALLFLICSVLRVSAEESNERIMPNTLLSEPWISVGIVSPVGGIPAILSASNEPDTPGLTLVQP